MLRVIHKVAVSVAEHTKPTGEEQKGSRNRLSKQIAEVPANVDDASKTSYEADRSKSDAKYPFSPNEISQHCELDSEQAISNPRGRSSSPRRDDSLINELWIQSPTPSKPTRSISPKSQLSELDNTSLAPGRTDSPQYLTPQYAPGRQPRARQHASSFSGLSPSQTSLRTDAPSPPPKDDSTASSPTRPRTRSAPPLRHMTWDPSSKSLTHPSNENLKELSRSRRNSIHPPKLLPGPEDLSTLMVQTSNLPPVPQYKAYEPPPPMPTPASTWPLAAPSSGMESQDLFPKGRQSSEAPSIKLPDGDVSPTFEKEKEGLHVDTASAKELDKADSVVQPPKRQDTKILAWVNATDSPTTSEVQVLITEHEPDSEKQGSFAGQSQPDESQPTEEIKPVEEVPSAEEVKPVEEVKPIEETPVEEKSIEVNKTDEVVTAAKDAQPAEPNNSAKENQPPEEVNPADDDGYASDHETIFSWNQGDDQILWTFPRPANLKLAKDSVKQRKKVLERRRRQNVSEAKEKVEEESEIVDQEKSKDMWKDDDTDEEWKVVGAIGMALSRETA
ncbi:MAG: hypothetical protein M1820_006859 [Bogoriella megaspora]|nr:MAG: hypothetical protein M1820_006859 [Bogoriella megaspora]